MNAVLIRVGIDQAYGRWNAPVDPHSNRFVYVPIPEKPGTPFHPGLERSYGQFKRACDAFAGSNIQFPTHLFDHSAHLDPDFEALTYGDDGARRGAGLAAMKGGDLVVFYASLKPMRKCEQRLIYAIIGLYVVDEVVRLTNVPESRWDENAHSRKSRRRESDIIVRARPGVSGRLERAMPIGEFRDHSYRVRADLLEQWGGLSVRDGYIQRSAVPPTFSQPERFYDWFLRRKPTIHRMNNPLPPTPKVFLVHLRRPKRAGQNPNEARDDPFWEFGSFGCTGCHSSNLFNPKRAAQLEGARLGFIQGGRPGSRLVLLTPPVTVKVWQDRCEAKWLPAQMPFRYAEAPILAANGAASDFPGLERLARATACTTIEGGLSSRFRTRARPLEPEVSKELADRFDRLRSIAPASSFASSYEEALPHLPPRIDTSRSETYHRRIRELLEAVALDDGDAATRIGRAALPRSKRGASCSTRKRC